MAVGNHRLSAVSKKRMGGGKTPPVSVFIIVGYQSSVKRNSNNPPRLAVLQRWAIVNKVLFTENRRLTTDNQPKTDMQQTRIPDA